MKVNQMTKNFSLTCNDNGEITEYVATVTSQVVSENRVALEFSGHDEGDPFVGNCSLVRKGCELSGKGEFRYLDADEEETVGAVITAVISDVEGSWEVEGSWLDEGDDEPYELFVELVNS
jgi:hypothetical protein